MTIDFSRRKLVVRERMAKMLWNNPMGNTYFTVYTWLWGKLFDGKLPKVVFIHIIDRRRTGTLRNYITNYTDTVPV